MESNQLPDTYCGAYCKRFGSQRTAGEHANRAYGDNRRLKVLLGIQTVEFAVFVGAAVHHDRAAADRAVFNIVGIATGSVDQGLKAFTAMRAAYFSGIKHGQW